LQAGTTGENEVILRIQSLPAFFKEVVDSMKERANYLLSGATNLSSMDQLNGQRAQDQVRALNGDVQGDSRLIGNKGPTRDAVLQGATDAVKTSNNISNAAIAVNSLLLTVPTSGGKPTVTTNTGTPVNGAKQWSFGSHKSAEKWESQMQKRGWTSSQIDEAITQGKSFSATNNVNKGNSATRFVHPTTGRSVVIDDVTKQILQVAGTGFRF